LILKSSTSHRKAAIADQPLLANRRPLIAYRPDDLLRDIGSPNIQKMGTHAMIGSHTPNSFCPMFSAVKKKYAMAPNIAM
jgi:hypothetical protein